MTDEFEYNVVSSGNVLDGFEVDDVKRKLAKLFQLPEQKAAAIIAKPCVIKKGLDREKAYAYKRKLESIGVMVDLKPIEKPKPAFDVASLSLEPMETETQSEVSEEVPVQPPLAISPDPDDGKVSCPKCGHVQYDAEQCVSCGIYMNKVRSAMEKEAAKNSDSPPNVSNVSSASSHRPQDELGQTTTYDTSELYSDLNVKALVVGAGVAGLGALLWKFIAITFGYELGVIAWAIGGIVGFAVAMTGAQGEKTAILCGIYALLAIMGGKYLVVASLQEEWSQQLSEASVDDVEYRQYYDEEINIAKQYLYADHDDQSIRIFMVEMGYTDFYNPEKVTDFEVENFKKITVPRFKALADGSMKYETWKEAQFSAIEEFSTLDLFKASFGILDIVFLFLGVGTAYRLGRGI